MSDGKITRTLHTHVIELGADKNLVLRILDNGMVDVVVELSETECYGVEISWSLFQLSMSMFINELKDNS